MRGTEKKVRCLRADNEAFQPNHIVGCGEKKRKGELRCAPAHRCTQRHDGTVHKKGVYITSIQ